MPGASGSVPRRILPPQDGGTRSAIWKRHAFGHPAQHERADARAGNRKVESKPPREAAERSVPRSDHSGSFAARRHSTSCAESAGSLNGSFAIKRLIVKSGLFSRHSAANARARPLVPSLAWHPARYADT